MPEQLLDWNGIWAEYADAWREQVAAGADPVGFDWNMEIRPTIERIVEAQVADRIESLMNELQGEDPAALLRAYGRCPVCCRPLALCESPSTEDEDV